MPQQGESPSIKLRVHIVACCIVCIERDRVARLKHKLTVFLPNSVLILFSTGIIGSARPNLRLFLQHREQIRILYSGSAE